MPEIPEGTRLTDDKCLKDWVLERTGNTWLYDSCKGVLKDLIVEADRLAREDERKKIGAWLWGVIEDNMFWFKLHKAVKSLERGENPEGIGGGE